MRDLVHALTLRSDPIRGFSWRREQRHRPGLALMVSTGRHHGAESLEEARVLLALDFAAEVVDVVSQPLRLRFDAARRRAHTPDFLVVTRSGTWLVDVRPEPLIQDADMESFAAAAEVAVACGWHYRGLPDGASMPGRRWTPFPRSGGSYQTRSGSGRACWPRPAGERPRSGSWPRGVGASQ